MPESFFESLKQLAGLSTPAEETWTCNPLVIVDDADELIWAQPAVVQYRPKKGKYEGGIGEAFDPDSEERILTFILLSIDHMDQYAIAVPINPVIPWGQTGATIRALEEGGEHLMLYTGSHAESYLQVRAQRRLNTGELTQESEMPDDPQASIEFEGSS